MPLPDAEGRGRLLDLYGQGLTLALRRREQLLSVTEGVSPAFIRELLRRATLLAAEAGDATAIDDATLERALGELRHGGGLTGALLGGPGAGGIPDA